jgi:tellurite resistance protein
MPGAQRNGSAVECAKHRSSLCHLPIGCFAMVMGYAGFSISLQQAELAFGYPTGISAFLVVCTVVIFGLLTVLYGAKTCLCFVDVCMEFNDPIDLHLFPTFSISLLLLATMISRLTPTAATALFLAGASLHFLLTIAVIHLWFNRTHFDVVHVNPAWLIPAVGNMLAAIAGVNLGFSELSWFFFSIGIVFWIVLLPIVTARLLFGPKLSERFAPTLFILLAPPAVSFITYVMLAGAVDSLARVFYYFALFTALFLLVQVPRLARLEFSLSWWAYSFPVAAMTVATWLMHEKTQSRVFLKLAVGLETLLTSVIIFLTIFTVIGTVRLILPRHTQAL